MNLYVVSQNLQRAQDLVNVEAYREWVLIGYLVCPTELLRPGAVDIAMVSFDLLGNRQGGYGTWIAVTIYWIFCKANEILDRALWSLLV